jgi:repressor LexA
LELSPKAYKLLRQTANQSQQPGNRQDGTIPLAGRVAAGIPIEAIENKERLSINSLFGNSDEIFALEVRGDSMTGEGINSGDFVICHKCSTANEGQMVVAIVDNENATLKRFYREKDAVRLQPANEQYEPIYSRNCRIEAVVLGVIKKF